MTAIRFCVALVAVLLSWATAHAYQTTSPVSEPAFNFERLYGIEQVTKIEIEIEKGSWDRLRLQRRDFVDAMIDPNNSPFDWVQGDITIDGVKISNVGIRKKGFLGSVDDDFPSLKIKLNEYVDQAPLGECKNLTLNNNKQDSSVLSQMMAYGFFNEVGVPAPKVGFATLFVNGKHLGVYSVVEPVDKLFLKNNFSSDAGDLLEGTLCDFSKNSILRMDHKSGPNSRSPDKWQVNQLSELLKQEELDYAQLEQLVDLTSFYRFWAAESLLAFWDGYTANQNNYFLYHNPETNKLHFVPWGADSLWSTMAGPFGGFSKANESVYSNAVLPHALLKSKEGQDAYLLTLTQLLEKHWNEDSLIERMDKAAKLIEPYLHSRQKPAAQAQKDMQRFITNRRRRVERELEKWPVPISPNPRRPSHSEEIGEISGDFSTFWQRAPKGQESNVNLKIVLGGKSIELTEATVTSKRFSMGWMSFGAAAESMPPIVEVVGKSSDNERYVLTISFDNADFKSRNSDEAKGSVRIRGSLMKGQPGGRGGPFGGPNMQFLQGKCELSQAASTAESPVVGRLDAKLLRIVGGFFGG